MIYRFRVPSSKHWYDTYDVQVGKVNSCTCLDWRVRCRRGQLGTCKHIAFFQRVVLLGLLARMQKEAV